MFKVKRYGKRFTLIELLAVVALISMLMALGVPAFARMIRGNKKNECARSIKLAMEQAQMRAASERRYVALIFPSGKVSDKLKPYRLGGFRTAWVKKTAPSSYEFCKWLDPEWRNAPDGAMLVKIGTRTADVEPDANNIVSNCAKTDADELNGADGELKKLSGLKDDDGSTSLDAGDNYALVFTPYGGVASTSKLYFLVSEATATGDKVVNTGSGDADATKLVYPSAEQQGETRNYRVLKVNNLTGRVEFYDED